MCGWIDEHNFVLGAERPSENLGQTTYRNHHSCSTRCGLGISAGKIS